ncbi:MAG: DnaA regulatory inactivator Hda, partial [Burkholderiaceae bacterium]|nr:DnaA regulatory inactivator Hda [Burkholderiaceae bacterium]
MSVKQLALDISLATGPTLARFFAGSNAAALQHLHSALTAVGESSESPPLVPTYLWGEPGSGKSHLLCAVRQTLHDQDISVGWLDASVVEPPDFDERWVAVIFDDVHLYDTAQQATAFNWFVNAVNPASGRQQHILQFAGLILLVLVDRHR